jgi:ubiquitin-conjugating enzyme E2 A
MANPAARRLLRDFKKICADPPAGISASPVEDDLFLWSALLMGPEGTPWEGGAFELALAFTDEYPERPPRVSFRTEVFHPNVFADGQICLDILRTKWSAAFDVSGLLLAIQSILTDPGLHGSPEGAANPEAERLYVNQRLAYERKVMDLVQRQLEAEASLSTEEA